MAGNIALIDRGVCTFSSKVQAALDAGAIAVVVVNSRDPSSSDGKYPILMTGVLVDLSAVMISKPDGAIIKTALGQGNVTVSITPDTSPVLGKYNAGRGASDTVFPVTVTTPGVYPLRCVWFEGGGGANIELFSVTPTGQKILLNDISTPGALKAYRTRSGVLQFSPPTLSGNVLTITWTGTGRLQEASNLTGNAADWITVSSPTNPYMVQVGTTGKKFYRLINP